MKITDDSRTVDIQIRRWNGSGYDPDWSVDFFNAGSLPYFAKSDTYRVDDVQYCIDQANEEAVMTTNEDGEAVKDENVTVMVDELKYDYHKCEFPNGEWDMTMCEKICRDAGLGDEWDAIHEAGADNDWTTPNGYNFETLTEKAAKILGVELF